MNNNSKRLFLGLIVSVIAFVSGISYAYFEAEVINAGIRNTSIATKSLSDLQIIDGTTSSSSNMIPGESITQTFQVKNDNDINLCFGLNWSNVVNTFVNTQDLQVTLSDGTNSIDLTQDIFPTTSGQLATNMRINANTTNNYTLTVTYVNTEADQTGDMGKNFSASITGEVVECTGADVTLQRLAKLNPNYVYTANSNNCLHTDSNHMITDFSATMSDEDDPIICSMEDSYGESYYLRGLHTDNNVKFANSCWKIVRVTGTGGLKLLYNGDLDQNGTCTTTSGTHNGFVGQSTAMSDGIAYGTSYTIQNNSYTLDDSSILNWSTDSASIVGKYTCLSEETTCDTIYYVSQKVSSTKAYLLKLNQDVNYATIGSTSYNENSDSIAYIGYMYDTVYKNTSKNLKGNTNEYYFGNSYVYNPGSSRPYELVDTTIVTDIDEEENYNKVFNHHYTCFYTTDNTCKTLYYVHSIEYLSSTVTYLYYVTVSGQETIENILNKMLWNDNVNQKDSTIKRAIDWWYRTNIEDNDFDDYLEDTIFCNNREFYQMGWWEENSSTSGEVMECYNNNNCYLKCPNKRDSFTVDDTIYGNGALTYPIGILTGIEQFINGNVNSRKIGVKYWDSRPIFGVKYAYSGIVNTDGSFDGQRSFYSANVRPSISLKPTTKLSGYGSASNPFVVQ